MKKLYSWKDWNQIDMTKEKRKIAFLLLLVVQVLFCNYLHLSQYIMVSILPVMILMSDIRRSTVALLFEAFICGFVVDFFADGVIGLNVLALVPVAFVRNSVVRLIFGDELFARSEDISVARQGLLKLLLALVLLQALFLLVYIWADSAGTRPLWFCAAKFALSLICGSLVCILAARVLSPEKSGWKW